MPYLFGTTYFAMTARPERAILIPCLHDEPYAHCAFVAGMLRSVRGVLFNAHAEAELGRRLAGHVERWAVVGTGFDARGALDVDGVRRRYGLRWPFVLYVGRREGSKNTPLLVDYFMRYAHRRRTELRLVMAGSGDPIPAHERIVDLKVDFDRDRDALYAASTIFCQPSVNESLSIVLMQAWLAGRPAIVHARCAVTREHCERANGGLWFDSYAEFEEIVDRLLADPALADGLGRNGRAYALREYGWPAVLERFERAMGEWVVQPSPVT
jgi:glycosyltransferase involved in cell wall biosynthesis